jgi:hypothetical protein
MWCGADGFLRLWICVITLVSVPKYVKVSHFVLCVDYEFWWWSFIFVSGELFIDGNCYFLVLF